MLGERTCASRARRSRLKMRISPLAGRFMRLDRMAVMEPIFIDVTWTTPTEGTDSRDASFAICEYARRYAGLTPMLHVTLTGQTREALQAIVARARASGIRNILALRGDPPRGLARWAAPPGGLSCAEELVRLIREEHGDWFCIGVAGFPEGYKEPFLAAEGGVYPISTAGDGSGDHGHDHISSHPRSSTSSDDTAVAAAVDAVRAKVAAGADFVLTQCVFDADAFLKFVARCRAAGVPDSVPIIPGILPVPGLDAFRRMTAYTGVHVPDAMRADMEACAGDDEAAREVGRQHVVALCRRLLEAGAPGLHLYTLNLELGTRAVLRDLGLARGAEARRLPWRPSVEEGRQAESVRPIFWANRPRSYLARTESWAEYPAARWGDAGNPAFQAVHESHFDSVVVGTAEDRRALWGESLADEAAVWEVFARYLEGRVPRLPWCDTVLLSETSTIAPRLISLNRAGFCTINSQPRVNGARSDDPVFGWGGAGGYVYQKAYVECFCSPAHLAALMAAAADCKSATFTAVDAQGHLYSNCRHRGVQAVTWGVFPGKEVVQPTVVDEAAFLAWKDEAFALWKRVWASAYDAASDTAELLAQVHDTWFLVHVVDHDFLSGDVFAVFEDAIRRLKPAAALPE